MGRSYPVPRSVKGESRILYIFTIRSFVLTVIFGVIGAVIWYVFGSIMNISLLAGVIMLGLFGGFGFLIGTAKIPDIPAVGVLRKAGGENVSDIIIRFLFFKRKKKIYMYNYKRGGK